MIQFYRVVGFSLLIAGSASLVSLLARLMEGLREPAFWLCVLTALGLGAAGTVVFNTRVPDNNEWIYALLLVAGIALSILVGGLIQWSR